MLTNKLSFTFGKHLPDTKGAVGKQTIFLGLCKTKLDGATYIFY